MAYLDASAGHELAEGNFQEHLKKILKINSTKNNYNYFKYPK